jgi:hypothetical protein
MKYPLAFLYNEKHDSIKTVRKETHQEASIFVLYAAKFVRDMPGGKLKMNTQCKVMEHIGSDPPGIEYCDQLQKFFAFLQPQITVKSITKYSQIPTMTPDEFLDFALHVPNPLLSSIFGLSTGCAEMDIDGKTSEKCWPDYQSQLLAISAAKDLMLRAIVHHPCHFQLMVNDLLEMEDLTQQVRLVLSRLRVIPSKQFTHSHQCKAVVADLRKKIEVGTHDLVLVNADNCGFKEISSSLDKVGYQQYTCIQTIIISEDVLRQCGIYSNDPDKRLSRVPAFDWHQLCEEDKTKDEGELARTLIEIKTAAIVCVSHSALEHIYIAANHILTKGFKLGQRTIRTGKAIDVVSHAQLVENTSLAEMSDPNLEAFLSGDEIGNGIRVNPQSIVRFAAPAIDEEEGLAVQENGDVLDIDTARKTNRRKVKTRYGDHVTLSAVKSDLASKRTVRALGDYALSINEYQLNQWKESDSYTEDAEHPIAEIGAFVMYDGQPAHQHQVAKTSDMHQAEPKWNGRVHGFFGGFHTLNKLYHAMGDLFANVFPMLLEPTRNTPARQQWFTHPGDPHQTQSETPDMLTAIYGSAAKYLYDGTGNIPSAKDIDAHMVARAKKYPICMVVLLYTRYAEVTKLMKASETLDRKGCVELYHQCLSLALPIFAMTHKTDYVRLIIDWFITWYCASDAFKTVYTGFIFTQMTTTGFPIWSDLFMEMSILDVRRHCGKVARRGLKRKLEYVCNQVPKRQRRGDTMKALQGIEESRETNTRTHIAVTDVLVKEFNHIHNTLQLWHYSEPPVIGRDTDTGLPIFAEEGDFKMPHKQLFNAKAADVINLGTKRSLKYCQVNNINEHNKINRSEEDAPLTKLKIRAEDRSAELKRAIILGTSIDMKELSEFKPIITRKEFRAATNKLIDLMTDKYNMKARKAADGKREDMILSLIQRRIKLYEHDKSAKDDATNRIKAEFQEKYRGLSVEERSEVLSSGLYALDTNVLNNERYSRPVCTEEALVVNRNDSSNN